MDVEQLEKQLEFWKRGLFVALGSSTTFLATTLVASYQDLSSLFHLGLVFLMGGYLAGGCASWFLFVDEQEMAESPLIHPCEHGFWISGLCLADLAQCWHYER